MIRAASSATPPVFVRQPMIFPSSYAIVNSLSAPIDPAITSTISQERTSTTFRIFSPCLRPELIADTEFAFLIPVPPFFSQQPNHTGHQEECANRDSHRARREAESIQHLAGKVV